MPLACECDAPVQAVREFSRVYRERFWVELPLPFCSIAEAGNLVPFFGDKGTHHALGELCLCLF